MIREAPRSDEAEALMRQRPDEGLRGSRRPRGGDQGGSSQEQGAGSSAVRFHSWEEGLLRMRSGSALDSTIA